MSQFFGKGPAGGFEVFPIGGGWFRHTPAPHLVRYTWGIPDDLLELTMMSVVVSPEGLHVQRNLVPLRTDEDLEGLERVLLIAHRQYTERLGCSLEAHSVTEDSSLYTWLGEQG